MAISKQRRERFQAFDADQVTRIQRMAWEDRTAFEAIYRQFGLRANEVVAFMRYHLSAKDFFRWRKRAIARGHLKHEKLRPQTELRFKCSRQRLDGSTKGWK